LASDEVIAWRINIGGVINDVHQSQFSLSQLSRGVQGKMFETASGQNGEFYVTPGVWNPVAGLGQLNVDGFSQAIWSLGYGE
jgi:hypothetical protein